MASMPGLMYSEEFSDLKFTCRGQAYYVHKAVVCSQSQFLKCAVTGTFMEATSGMICMDEFSHGAIQCMIQYFYTGQYDIRSVTISSGRLSVEDTDVKDTVAKVAVTDGTTNATANATTEAATETTTKAATGALTEAEAAHMAVVVTALRTFFTPHEQPLEHAESAMLWAHIAVISIADYYGIKPLLAMALAAVVHGIRDRTLNQEAAQIPLPLGALGPTDTGFSLPIEDLATSVWFKVVRDMPTLINKAQESTGCGPLIYALADSVSANISHFVETGALWTINGTSEFYHGLACSLRVKLSLATRQLEAEQAKNEYIEAANRGLQSKLDQLDEATRALRKFRSCNNDDCEQEFGGVIEDGSDKVRCVRCGHEHCGPRGNFVDAPGP